MKGKKCKPIYQIRIGSAVYRWSRAIKTAVAHQPMMELLLTKDKGRCYPVQNKVIVLHQSVTNPTNLSKLIRHTE